MNDKTNALQKLYDRFIMNRLNKIFEENNLTDRITKIEVSFNPVTSDEHYKSYSINIELNVRSFTTDAEINIGYLILNLTEYVVMETHLLSMYFIYNENDKPNRLVFDSDGDKKTDKEAIDGLLKDLL